MKHLSVFVIFITFILQGYGQTYTPMLGNLEEWHLTSCYHGCLTDVYHTDGDTLIDGKSYKILDGYHYISRTFLLREDIQEKKVYLNLKAPGYNQEYLLYDFSLEVGDSIRMQNPITPFPEDGGFFTLDSIVTKPLVNANLYDFFYFSPSSSNTISSWNAVWVEGLGSLSMITAPGGNPDFYGVGQISCFFKENELVYTDLEVVDECASILSRAEVNAMDGVELFKPVNEQICYLKNATRIMKVEVYSIQGKTVLTYSNHGNEIVSLDLSTLDQGMYFVLVKGEGNEKKVFKVIK